MSDYHISYEARQLRLNEQRQKIKENMTKKHVQQIKSIQTNDSHNKISLKFSHHKEDYSPLVGEENNNDVRIGRSKFAYDGPQAFELSNLEGNYLDGIDVLQMGSDSKIQLAPGDDGRGAIVIKNDYIDGLKEASAQSTFDYSPLDVEHSEDYDDDDDVDPSEDWRIIRTKKSSDTLNSQPPISMEFLTLTESADNGLNDSNTSGIAVSPCHGEISRDNNDSNEDVDSIQLEQTDEKNGYKPLTTFVDLPVEIEGFVTSPAPENYVVKCRISRDNRGVDKGMYPIYYLHLERSDAKPLFLLAARRRKMSKTSNYLISCDATDMKRDGYGFLAKLRSNFVGTQFTIFDNGHSPGSRRDLVKKPSRKELAAIIYDSNVLGFKGPRKMTIIIPGMTSEKVSIDFSPKEHEDGLIECWKKKNMHNLIELHNKKPVWNDDSQSYVLNFHGRVTQASVKNFQVVHDNDVDYIVMQFGRTSDNSFSMDYSYPLSAVQAFGIALSSFDGKLACE